MASTAGSRAAPPEGGPEADHQPRGAGALPARMARLYVVSESRKRARTPFLTAGLRGGKAPPPRAGATTRCWRAVSGSASPPSSGTTRSPSRRPAPTQRPCASATDDKTTRAPAHQRPGYRDRPQDMDHGYRGHLPFIEIRARIAPGQRIAAHLLIAVLAAVHLIPARGIDKCRTSIRESMRNQGHHAPARIF